MTRKQKNLKQLRINKNINKMRIGNRKRIAFFDGDSQEKGFIEMSIAKYSCPPIRRFFICTENQHIIQGLYQEGDKCPNVGCNGILKMYNGHNRKKRRKLLRK